jgi:hypothetical protein
MGTSADLMGSSQCHPVYIDNKPYSVQLCPATPAFQALPAPHPAISSSYPEISIIIICVSGDWDPGITGDFAEYSIGVTAVKSGTL